MADQLSFDGLDAESPPTDRLFFGIYPEVPVRATIGQRAGHLRDKHGLSGWPLATDRFLVTLHPAGDYVGLPPRVVEDAKAAAATVAMAPFQITFDRVGSFAGKPRKLPFVLRGGDGLAGVIAFQKVLFEALQKSGLVHQAKPNFTPHVTLLYDDRTIAEEPVEPISWTVREFVLVHSLLGKTQHIPLARWSLRD